MGAGQDLKSFSHNRVRESCTTSATPDLHQVGTAFIPSLGDSSAGHILVLLEKTQKTPHHCAQPTESRITCYIP